jgi:hypothetical protein
MLANTRQTVSPAVQGCKPPTGHGRIRRRRRESSAAVVASLLPPPSATTVSRRRCKPSPQAVSRRRRRKPSGAIVAGRPPPLSPRAFCRCRRRPSAAAVANRREPFAAARTSSPSAAAASRRCTTLQEPTQSSSWIWRSRPLSVTPVQVQWCEILLFSSLDFLILIPFTLTAVIKQISDLHRAQHGHLDCGPGSRN